MRDPSRSESVLDFSEARQVIAETLDAIKRDFSDELVPLEAAYGRVLAADITADRDYPAMRRSLRDGYAVRSADLPGTLRVLGETRAGGAEHSALRQGEAIEIMTGAPLPSGADAVVMVEHVRDGHWAGNDVRIDRGAEPGQFVNKRGAEAKVGSTLIPKRTRLDASHIATLAMTGCASVPVIRKPRVAILATGDEIVPVEGPVEPHQIRNSNSYMLAASVRTSEGEPTILSIAPDSALWLEQLCAEGLRYDLLLVSGGVSAGKYDLVKPTLRKLCVSFHFERVRIQPGQPTAFGTAGASVVFGLPGNPASSLITFQLFARLAWEILAGVERPVLPLLEARFEEPFRHRLGLTRFLPARLSEDGRHLRHIPWQGSSDIPALARANCFLVARHDRESWEAGDLIPVLAKA